MLNDPKTLQGWLEQVQARGFTWSDFQSHTDSESLDYANTLVVASEPIYVLDPDLNLIAAAPFDDPSAIRKPFKSRGYHGLGVESILEAALVGDKNYLEISMTSVITAAQASECKDPLVRAHLAVSQR